MAFKINNYCGVGHPGDESITCELPPFHHETGTAYHCALPTRADKLHGAGWFWQYRWHGGTPAKEPAPYQPPIP